MTATQARNDIPALTSLRGIAAWWVVGYHFRDALNYPRTAWLLPLFNAGYLAVDFFFVLSGFVIALNYADRLVRRDTGSVMRFLWLRLARIYPLHLTILLLFLVNPLSRLLLHPHAAPDPQFSAISFLANLTLTQDWGLLRTLSWNMPSWSISTEWAAYLTFPLLAAVLPWFRGHASRPIVAAIGLVVALYFIFHLLPYGLNSRVEHLGLPRCLLEFSLGAMVYALMAQAPASAWLRIGSWVIAAALLVAFAAGEITDVVAIPAASALIVLACALDHARQSSLPSRVLAHPVLVWLGTISYSTYMVHFLIKTWVKLLLVTRPGGAAPMQFAIYLVVVLVASWGLYHGVEKPAQKWLVRSWRPLAA